TNSSVKMPFGLTGKYYDEVTGLLLYLNRWYDPRLGQFVSEDPTGINAGDPNFRRYVRNASLLHIDPSGLDQSGFFVWLYTGNWTVEDNVWDAAMEAAG